MFGNNVAAAGNSSSNENEMQKLANTLAFALRHDPDLKKVVDQIDIGIYRYERHKTLILNGTTSLSYCGTGKHGWGLEDVVDALLASRNGNIQPLIVEGARIAKAVFYLNKQVKELASSPFLPRKYEILRGLEPAWDLGSGFLLEEIEKMIDDWDTLEYLAMYPTKE